MPTPLTQQEIDILNVLIKQKLTGLINKLSKSKYLGESEKLLKGNLEKVYFLQDKLHSEIKGF